MHKKIVLVGFLLLLSVLGKSQNALNFDGVNDYVQCPMAGPTGTNSRTVEAWIKIPSLFPTQKVILDWGDIATGSRFTLNIINGLSRIEVGGNGFSATNAISTNTWHHIAATFDNSATLKLKLFVDGLLAASGNPSVPVATSSTNGIIVGRRNDATGHFAGLIDEVRVWSIARTQSQIAAEMNSQFCIPLNGLTAYFNFDQGTAGGSNTGLTTLNNLAAGNNNGTLNGFALTGSTSNWVSGLSILPLNATITQAGSALTSLPSNGTYQWLSCNTGNSIVPGATLQSFTPTQNGSYAVVIAKNGCVDTSSCLNMAVEVEAINKSNGFNIFPNPAVDYIVVDYRLLDNNSTFILTDIFGREVKKIHIANPAMVISISDLKDGIYFFQLRNENSILKTGELVVKKND